jgi:hypothetical protein
VVRNRNGAIGWYGTASSSSITVPLRFFVRAVDQVQVESAQNDG